MSMLDRQWWWVPAARPARSWPRSLMPARRKSALLVNATTQGLRGQPPLQLALDALPESARVTDLIYSPLKTPLLVEAQQRGHRIIDGLGMLLHQARPGFTAWFGVEPRIDEALRRHVLAGLAS
jgi:shikimate dehydrogenase